MNALGDSEKKGFQCSTGEIVYVPLNEFSNESAFILTNGYCAVFAFVFQKKYGGEIYECYDKVLERSAHIIVKYNNQYWDAFGIIKEELFQTTYKDMPIQVMSKERFNYELCKALNNPYSLILSENYLNEMFKC